MNVKLDLEYFISIIKNYRKFKRYNDNINFNNILQ